MEGFMAIITDFVKEEKEYPMRNEVSKCEAHYNRYSDTHGILMLRLQTFGSNQRKHKGKQSQVLHIGKEKAKELIEILKDTFDI
jgi:hypothetical protein